MEELLKNPEFWKAMASLAWPLVALIVFLALRGRVLGLFTRNNLTIKVAGMELSVADAAKNIGEQVADLQKRVALNEQGSSPNTLDPATDSVTKDLNKPLESSQADNVSSKRDFAYKTLNQFSILWVDDFPSNNAFIIGLFQSSGFLVRTVLSTHAALIEIKHQTFDIIISDLGRVEDGTNNPFAGLDLIKSIRQTDKKTPILIFAGSRGIENKAELVREGADEVTSSAVDVQGFVYRILRQKSDLIGQI